MFIDSLFDGIKGIDARRSRYFQSTVRSSLDELRESVGNDRLRADLAIEIIEASLQMRPEDRFVAHLVHFVCLFAFIRANPIRIMAACSFFFPVNHIRMSIFY